MQAQRAEQCPSQALHESGKVRYVCAEREGMPAAASSSERGRQPRYPARETLMDRRLCAPALRGVCPLQFLTAAAGMWARRRDCRVDRSIAKRGLSIEFDAISRWVQ